MSEEISPDIWEAMKMVNNSNDGEKSKAGLKWLRREIQIGKSDIETGRYTELYSHEALQEYMDDILRRVLAAEDNF